MNTDPIADLLTRIRNAMKANHEEVEVPHSNIKENIIKIMKKYGFIENYITGEDNRKKILKIKLRNERKNMNLIRISKSGQRIYSQNKDLKQIKSGLGIRILSTSKGIMSNVDAKKQNLGGEIICEIY